MLPVSLYSDTYMKIPATSGVAISGATNGGNTLTPNNSYGSINYDLSIATIDEWMHGIDIGGFATGYKEEDYGYISKIKLGVEYHLTGSAFGAGERFEIMVREAGVSSGESDWLRNWNSPYPTVDGTVVGDSTKDIVWSQEVTPTVYNFYKVWSRINGDAADSVGFDLRGIWTPTDNSETAGAAVLIDEAYIKVLTKLLVTGNTLNSGVAVSEHSTDVELLHVTLKSYSNSTIDIDSIKIDLEGTVVNSDVSLVKIYLDSDEDGVVSGTDTLLGSAVPVGMSATITAAPSLIDDVTHNSKLIVAVDLKDNIISGTDKYIGARIVDDSYIALDSAGDEVLQDGASGRSATYVVDTVNPNPLFPIYTGNTSGTRVKITKKATLSCSISASSTKDTDGGTDLDIKEGDPLLITVTVTNTSSADAKNVIVTLPLTKVSVTGTPVVTTADYSEIVDIAGSGSHDFIFNYIATAEGSFSFKAKSDFKDLSNGNSYSTLIADCTASQAITISTASSPVLTITEMSLSPAELTTEQTATLTVKVRNDGDAEGNFVGINHATLNTSWQFLKIGTGTATRNGGSWNKETLSIGEEETWIFEFTPTGAGSLSFKCYATGFLVPSKVYATSNSITVHNPATIVINGGDYSVNPTVVGKNSSFNLFMRVTNTGGVTMNNVSCLTPSFSVASGNPSPLPNVHVVPVPEWFSIEPGESHLFTWVFNSNAVSDIGFVNIGNIVAEGKDSYTNATKNTGAAKTISNYEIDSDVHPKLNFSTSASINMMIAYSYNSDYYIYNDDCILYAYSATGTLKWSVDLGAYGQTNAGKNTWVAYDSNWKPVVLVGTISGRIYAIQDNGTSASGYANWTTSIQNSYISLSDSPVYGIIQFDDVTNNGLFVTAGHTVFRYNFETRKKNWEWSPGPINIDTVPVIDNTYVYVGMADGTIRSISANNGTYGVSSGNTGGAVTSPFLYNQKLYATNAAGIVMEIDNPTSSLSSSNDLNLTTTNLTDPWVGLEGKYLWTTDYDNHTVYKIDLSSGTPVREWMKNLTDFTTVTHVGSALEFDNRVYIGGKDNTLTKGRIFVLKKEDGSIYNSAWPYLNTTNNSGYINPVCLDAWNSCFLLGCETGDSQLFSIPKTGTPPVLDMISLLHFDEGSGLVALDSGGANHDGVITGATWTNPGYNNKKFCLDFDGVNDEINDLDGGDYLNGLSAITFSLWIKSDLTNVDKGIFFCKAPTQQDQELGIRYDKQGWATGGKNLIKFCIQTSGGTTQVETEDDTQTTDWQHLVIIWDGTTDGKIYLWINGIVAPYNPGTKPGDSGPVFGTISGCDKIMWGNGTKNQHWDGKMDEMRVYNRALSEDEILSLSE